MAGSELQLAQLISRLLERTRAGRVKWESAYISGTFQTRFGSYVIQLSGQARNLLLGGSIELVVKKLSGETIASTRSGPISAISSLNSSHTTVSPAAMQELTQLYDLVSDTSAELDELLSLIG